MIRLHPFGLKASVGPALAIMTWARGERGGRRRALTRQDLHSLRGTEWFDVTEGWFSVATTKASPGVIDFSLPALRKFGAALLTAWFCGPGGAVFHDQVEEPDAFLMRLERRPPPAQDATNGRVCFVIDAVSGGRDRQHAAGG